MRHREKEGEQICIKQWYIASKHIKTQGKKQKMVSIIKIKRGIATFTQS